MSLNTDTHNNNNNNNNSSITFGFFECVFETYLFFWSHLKTKIKIMYSIWYIIVLCILLYWYIIIFIIHQQSKWYKYKKKKKSVWIKYYFDSSTLVCNVTKYNVCLRIHSLKMTLSINISTWVGTDFHWLWNNNDLTLPQSNNVFPLFWVADLEHQKLHAVY